MSEICAGLCWPWRSYLDSGFGEVDPAGQVLPDKSIGVVRPFKHPFQSLELAAVEGGAIPALLPLLLLLCVHLLIWRRKKRSNRGFLSFELPH